MLAMKTLAVRLAAFACFALLCAVCAYWLITLSSTHPAAIATELPEPPHSGLDTARLMNSEPAAPATEEVHVAGILSLGPGKGAAAIIVVGDNPARTLAVGQFLDHDTRVAEVRGNSVVFERGGARSEVFLARPASASGYLR